MKPPLHELVLAYKMECDRLTTSNETTMTKIFTLFCLSSEYGELMKLSPDIGFNDIEVWGAMLTRYMKQI